MRRASKPMPQALKGLSHNASTGFYEIKENEITYQLPFHLVRLLRDYYQYFLSGDGFLYPTVSRWYDDLDKFRKKEVIRIGNVIPGDNNEFIPDVSPMDE